MMAEAERTPGTDLEKQRVALFRKAVWDYMVEGRKQYLAKQEDVPLTVEKRKAIPRTIITRSSGFRQVPFQEQDGPTL